jgi:hypothetical protein
MLPVRTFCKAADEDVAKEERRTPEMTFNDGGRGLDGSEGVTAGDVACGDRELDSDEPLDWRVLGDAVSMAEATTMTDGVKVADLVAESLPLEARLAVLLSVCADSAVVAGENVPDTLADGETRIDCVATTLALRVAARDSETMGVLVYVATPD